ncbi:sn-glycerol-3-phosphate ABC transporter ATP-binding protein UgpC [Stappia sp. F7233]|uniref:sn-glycerol-3-phosphate ABC transporter ATP-binding protein UgpC n=1 Tax=Stappia albiluteola TaxID=2758565 RepID=A0A839ABF7_9HYPH|nr:sn-glycerol-3-phosphate ABC transporter ATP-binding protein UgpC [Stappia albiluteola]MBA5776039.1 sn-glycerol-3-phosphate ABC transporter ATP-binding protein UgpC [Stappia albiluteola]
MAEVVLKNVSKDFGSVKVIRGVDLSIADGEFAVFVGPSGCGKSTLLRLVAGLEDISGGDLYIGGDRANAKSPKERGIAMVFQSYALYPHMTVYENMAFGLSLSGGGKAEIDAAVRKAADILELTPLLERLPKQLSGGQRQRVAIGRAIVRNPRVFLFDEPLSNLDAALRVQMRIEIAKLHKEIGATMVYVTHDQVEAMTLADKIVVLNAGNVEQVGAPLELYHHPRNMFVAGFIGSPKMNFLATRVESVSEKGLEVALPGGGSVTVPVRPDGLSAGDMVTLGIRPEHFGDLAESGSETGLSGTVDVIEHLGEATLAYVKLADGTLATAKIPGDAALREGQDIRLALPGSQCHLFRGDETALPRL